MMFFFDKDDDMGGDNEKEKEKDDSEEISQHVRLYMILVVFVTIMLWQKIYGTLLDDVFHFSFDKENAVKGNEDEEKCDSGNAEKQNNDNEESSRDTLVDDFQVNELKILNL